MDLSRDNSIKLTKDHTNCLRDGDGGVLATMFCGDLLTMFCDILDSMFCCVLESMFLDSMFCGV